MRQLNFIFNTDQNSSQEIYYVLKGYEDLLDGNENPITNNPESEHIVAKCKQNKKPKSFQADQNNFTYYILSSPNSDLYDPLKYYKSIKDKRQYDFIDKTCKDSWSFKEVNKITFDKYLNFLKTQNISWLKDAQRDLK